MRGVAFTIVGFAIALAAVMILVAALRDKPLSVLEIALWEVMSLSLGLFGSFLFGRYAAHGISHDAIRPHARSALRSVLVLHRGLQRLSRAVRRLNNHSPDPRLDSLQAQVQDQVAVAASTIADWRDVIPDDYEDVVATLDQLNDRREDWEDGDSGRTH